MRFRDRNEAARALAARLEFCRGQNPLVLAIPRGGVLMGRVIADNLGGELDVVLVHKLRAPRQPEFAIGSIDERGHVFMTTHGLQMTLPAGYLEHEKHEQLALLMERRRTYTRARHPVDPTGRVVIVVDDGIATGATMIAALDSIRQRGPKRLVAAAAVAPPGNVERVRGHADEVVCLITSDDFIAVGQFFDDFRAVEDRDVVEALGEEKASHPEIADPEVSIPADGRSLAGTLACPPNARGIVIFAHGSGSSRLSPRNRHIADFFNAHGIATLLFDLLTPQEDRVYELRFDIALLSRRLVAATEWVSNQPSTHHLPVGYFGASTGAAAALTAAVETGSRVSCIVSRGGRPDLAAADLGRVQAPTLLIVGGEDHAVMEMNREVFTALRCTKEMFVVPGATHLFEEPGTLEQVARQAECWFEAHLKARLPVAVSRGA
jgi:predicted phosphoribosyltransferase/predicted alpha/beta-hydrolase family hydrolase